jgi:hypothetical protein
VSESFRASLQGYTGQESRLLVLAELLLCARTPDEYATRRALYLKLAEDPRSFSAEKAKVLLHAIFELPEPRFESREELVCGLCDRIQDRKALSLALSAMGDSESAARVVVERLGTRPDALPLLAALLCDPALEELHATLSDAFLATARARREALARWASEERETFFRPEIFNLLFERAAPLLGPVCKQILTEGTRAERMRLVDRLAQDGSAKALRLLVLGVTYDEEPCDPELIRGLGAFRHPLAVAVLRELVQRSNTEGVRWHEAASALAALHETGTDEARQFLRAVVGHKSLLLPLYRHELRVLASRVLESGECHGAA